jgi:two-component system sensor histidine kinase KdpD
LKKHRGFVWGALTNVVTTTVAFKVAPHAQLAHLMIIHLLGAVLISTRYGMAVSTFTALTGALAFDYFCIPPIFGFALPDLHSVVIFAGMMVVALFVCWLNQGLREQRAAARASEARTQALCELSLDLSQEAGQTELRSRAERHLRDLFGPDTRLVLGASVAPDARTQLQPVSRGKDLGFIVLPSAGGSSTGRAERLLLLQACADRVAEALERLALREAARRAEVDAELQRNRNALLSSVSHDLKTPLASILTAGTSLLGAARSDRAAVGQQDLLETIVQEAERMNGVITNLLSVTRFESGSAAINKDFEALDDLIFTALSRFSSRLTGREVRVDLPHDLPLLELDPVLVDQLLVNLLENVLRYTPAGSPVELRVRIKRTLVAVEVRDRGPGIPAHERERVFDKFVRGHAAHHNDGGTGLGLTICRAIARAHGGEISARGRRGGGAILRLLLPFTIVPPNARQPVHRRMQA